jgi:hypothetical protein
MVVPNPQINPTLFPPMKILEIRNQAFTRTDLVVVLAAIGLLAVLIVQAQDLTFAKAKSERIRCVSNLKQIGLAFRMWSNDNKDRFPMRVEAKDGGSLEAIAAGETFRHFAAISNELVSMKILVCPSDTRTAVTNVSQLQNTNISYFVALDADETKPQMLLSGDRNLTNGLPMKKAVLDVSVDAPAGWTAEMHVEAGNIGLADGSAQQVTTTGLRRQIEQHRVDDKPAPQRLQFPE